MAPPSFPGIVLLSLSRQNRYHQNSSEKAGTDESMCNIEMFVLMSGMPVSQSVDHRSIRGKGKSGREEFNRLPLTQIEIRFS